MHSACLNSADGRPARARCTSGRLLLAATLAAWMSSACSSAAPAKNGSESGGSDSTEPGTSGEPGSEPGEPGREPEAGGPDDPAGAGTGPIDPSTGLPIDPGPGATAPGVTPEPSGPVAPPPAAAGATECLDPELIGPTPIRRISAAEYTNAVRDVFQAVINPGQLPADEKLGLFQANVATRVTADFFERYRSLSDSVATDAVANFAAISGCASTADTACVGPFLDGAARRLFHGTLEPADSQRIQELYTSLAAETDAETALGAAVEFMLLSPRFLFMVELGGSGTATRSPLSAAEVAGRLAAFLWRTVPDAALLAAADAGELDTPEGVRSRADAMLADDRAGPTLEAFGAQLLRIIPPAPGADALEQQKKAQVGEIFATARTDAALTFDSLITGQFSPSGSELQNFYGSEDRRGILLTAGFLSSNINGVLPSPVKRGYVIRAALLCGVVPPPADPVDMQLTDDNMGGTVQETFNAHSDVPECWACHKLMDPIGDAFGQYDAQGSFDAALANDTSGTITPDDTADPGGFTDVSGLLALLAEDDAARQCFVLQMSRFALGRNETVEDACGIESVTDAFAGASYSVRELILNIASSSMFLHRNPVVAGGTCR